MNIRLGEKIRNLRKQKNISQEILAQYLGISFQAVSKWENGDTMPDVTMIPAIAAFFDVSTDELFDFNRLEINRKVHEACWSIAEYRNDEPERAEHELRELLRQYPGNDIILTNLTYVLQTLNRDDELIRLCKTLIETTAHDDIRYDTARILAETYKKTGEYALCKQTIDLIPEFFSHIWRQKRCCWKVKICSSRPGSKRMGLWIPLFGCLCGLQTTMNPPAI